MSSGSEDPAKIFFCRHSEVDPESIFFWCLWIPDEARNDEADIFLDIFGVVAAPYV